MNILSDTESSDSDTGRRYKTESTRYKIKSARDEFSLQDSAGTSLYGHGYSKTKTRNREHDFLKQAKLVDKGNRKHNKIESSECSKLNLHEYNSGNKYKSKNKHGNRHSHHISSSKERSSSSNKNYRSIDIDEKKDHSGKHKKDKRDKLRANDGCSNRVVNYECQRNDNTQLSQELKSNTNTKDKSQEIQSNADENRICGPSLPPHMLKKKPHHDNASSMKTKIYGPSLPSIYTTYTEPDDKNEISKIIDADIGIESEDEILIGPVLEHTSNKNETYLKLEKRAIELKLAKLNEDDKIPVHEEREEWMISLPELRTVADLGITARQFRTKVHDEIKDRSLWTETPRDRENKAEKGKDSSHDNLAKMKREKTEKIRRERRDAEQEDMVRKHKKKHKLDESLLKMHQKNMKKKAEKESFSLERRPFSRDTDLKVNRFDEAMKKSILKKAQLLDTRFNSGQSKFL